MKISKYKYLFLLMLVIGCKHKTAQQQLADFINDPGNKITQHLKAGDVNVTVKWLPYEYRNKQSALNNPAPAEDYCYFDVRFEKEKAIKYEKSKVMYLDFDMQKDFILWSAGDSLVPAICQKIENGISGSYQYLVAFENRSSDIQKSDFALLYNDKIFGIGMMAFVYKQKDIQKIPITN